MSFYVISCYFVSISLLVILFYFMSFYVILCNFMSLSVIYVIKCHIMSYYVSLDFSDHHSIKLGQGQIYLPKP
jgi:hypothetical protein